MTKWVIGKNYGDVPRFLEYYTDLMYILTEDNTTLEDALQWLQEDVEDI